MRGCLPLLLLLTGCSTGHAIQANAIVSNNPCIDAVLAEIAAPGQIGAVSIYSHDADSASAPVDWARKLPALGTSAEEIIAARPRLVLTGNLASSGTNAALAKAGVKTLAFGVPATVEESVVQIQQIGDAIGRTDAGNTLARRISIAAQQQPPHHKTAIIWQAGGFVAGKGTLQDALLQRAGFTNASAAYGLKQWDILPVETLLSSPPDVIFMPRSATGDDGRALSARLRLLRNVKGRTRIVSFPDKLLFCGGPTIIDAMRLLR